MRTTPALDITSLHSFYQQGGSIFQIIEAVFAHISEVNDPGIFLHLADKKALLVEAEKLGAYDPAKPLFGVPFAVKDNIDVAGMPTTAGCPDYTYYPDKDATVVRLLKEAGALVIGKTNLDQFATGLVGVRSPYPIPRNAIDPTLVPGGSSSGSAVATAHGIVSFALGTDTAGSGRIPAGLNNIVGLKPSVGALSSTGVVPACRTLDCVSIFSLTVDDAWRVFSVAAQQDETDAYSKDLPAKGYGSSPPVLKVGVPALQDRKFFGDEAMAAAYSDALKTLEEHGHHIVETPFADFYDAATIASADALKRRDLGRISPGAKADIAVFDMADSMIAPRIDPIQTLVYGATGRVTRATIVDGRISMRDGAVAGIDLVAAREQAQRQFDGLVAKYPERTFRHPPVEDIFPPSYPLPDHASEVSR